MRDATAGTGHRDFAAHHHLRDFARNRRHRGFGENARDAVALERLDRQRCAARPLQGQRGVAELRVDDEGVVVGERAPAAAQESVGAVGGIGGNAELLEHRARNLGHGDLQHHLIVAANDQSVDDVSVAVAAPAFAAGAAVLGLPHREALGYVDGALRVGRRSHVARQDDRVVHRARDDLRSWNRGFKQRPQFADVATDAEFVFRELPALRVDREHRRLTLGGAHQIDLARRPHDRVGDGGIAHDDLRRVARQVEHDGFSDAHLNAARRPRKLGRPALVALLRARGGEQQRRAHRRGESGADPFVRQAAHAGLSVAVAGKNLRSHHEIPCSRGCHRARRLVVTP